MIGLFVTTLALFITPVVVGLAGVIIPAFGYFPSLGLTELSAAPFAEFLAQKRAYHALWLSLFIGLVSSAASVLACFILLSCGTQTGIGGLLFSWYRRIMGPLIAVPHSTIAIALLFLLAPSGFLVRLISPELTGWQRPPAFGIVPDQTGWLLIAGLMLKEIPFLLFIALALSQTLAISRLQHLGQSLGYHRVVTWLYVIWPQIYRQMRLPILAVVAYSLSVVDMTLILGPGLPPPLAVLVLQGFYDADLGARVPASAGALLQIIIIMIAVCLWLIGEMLCGIILRFCLAIGTRFALFVPLASGLFFVLTAGFALLMLGLMAISLWAFANRWHFSDKLPSDFGLRFWQSEAAFGRILSDTLLIAGGASLCAVIMVGFWLEVLQKTMFGTDAMNKFMGLMSALLFIPLFVPQISLLFGLQVALSWSYLDGYHGTIIFVHCLYILPYVWLILAPAYQSYDRRYEMISQTMGMTVFAHFWKMRLPLLGHNFASALVLGVAVSIALYLPSLFAGAGRITTITMEAVTLAASGARGPSAQAALMQMIIPLIAFLVMRLCLRLRFRRFSAMQSHDS